MENSSNEIVAERVGVSRRVVVKSAAWSLPVFATVAITPAFAASGDAQHVNMTATRNQQTISFSWTLSIPTNTTIASVSRSTVDGITFTGSPVINGSVVTFTGTIPNGNYVPGFQATVTLASGASTLFNVTGGKVPSSVSLNVNAA